MLRVLATRRWLGALALAAAFAVAAFFLGQWQWHRYEDRKERADRITAHYDAAPVPLAGQVGTDPMPAALEWTRVRIPAGMPRAHRCWSETARTRGLRLRGAQPLRPRRRPHLLVDRGWVLNAKNAQTRPEVPPNPSGEVTVTGWLRPSEPSLGHHLPAGQLASINIREARGQLDGTDLLGAYVVLDREQTAQGQTPPRPARLERPDTGLGPHQAYAFQWWGSMAVGFILVFFGVRREHRDALEAESGEPLPGRPRKVRIWDEEDA